MGPVVVLLGDPGYYHRFGFRLGSDCGIMPPALQDGWFRLGQLPSLGLLAPVMVATQRAVFTRTFGAARSPPGSDHLAVLASASRLVGLESWRYGSTISCT